MFLVKAGGWLSRLLICSVALGKLVVVVVVAAVAAAVVAAIVAGGGGGFRAKNYTAKSICGYLKYSFRYCETLL